MDDSSRRADKAKAIAIVAVVIVIAAVYIIVTLSKDNTDSSPTSDINTSQTSGTSGTPSNDTTSPSSGSYTDGTYSASGSYRTPETTETINVTLTLEDGVVTTASVQQKPQDKESEEYQSAFRSNYKPSVVGKKIDDINLSRVSGSSLTSNGFNKALEDIKKQAQSEG